MVNVTDLLLVILNWDCPSGPPCPGDANGDGLVDVQDQLIVMNDWYCVSE